MTKIVVRHGLSEANNRDNYGTPAFDNPESPLMPIGKDQAIKLGQELITIYGREIMSEPVAVSEMRRAEETALVAGFSNLTYYPELNEEKGGLSDSDVADAIRLRRPPEVTKEAARYLLEHPPKERVWITHGLLIATLCQELGEYTDQRFIPRFCEVRELQMSPTKQSEF
jgi:broad specificity phosphatase PhoE